MLRENWKQIKSTLNNDQSYKTYLVLLFDILMLVLSWKLSFYSSLAVLLSQLLLCLSLIHFYLIMHEASHSAISNYKIINEFIGHVCGWLVLMPYLPRKQSHLLHHTWTGHPVRDPANKRMIEKFSVMTKKQEQKLEFIWRNWIPVIVLNDRIGLWRNPVQITSIGESKAKFRQEVIFNYIYAFFYIGLFTFLIKESHFLHFINWFVPSFFCLALLEELVNLPHHAETPLLHPEDKALPYWNQGSVTHSCKTVPFWSKYILLNFNLHTAHHFFPNIAWYHLPKIHQKIEALCPEDLSERKLQNEIDWSLKNRKRSLLSIMGHYFNKITN